MAGYVIYNGFWNKTAPSPPVTQLALAGERLGLPLTPVKNTEVIAAFSGNGVSVTRLQAGDFALVWDKDVRLLQALEACGVRLFNSARAVAVCDDKAATHLALARAGVPMPRTLVAPMTYREIDPDAAEPFVQTVLGTFSLPVIVKECFGSFGQQVFLAEDETSLRRLVAERESRPFLVQEFIAASRGRDRRLYVVGDRVAAAMERRHPTDFRANIGAGGSGTAYVPTPEETALALRCARVLGLDFAGVDLLVTPDGPLVCEVNASAFFEEISACTGVDMAAEIVTYVKNNL